VNRKLRLCLAVVTLLPALVAGYLYLFAKSSSAYKPAVRSVLESREVVAYLGEAPQTTLLLGAHQTLGNTSCSTLTFRVAGAERAGLVAIFLVQSAGGPWAVKEVNVGWSTQGQRVCSEFQ
jgi:hypothetical protein